MDFSARLDAMEAAIRKPSFRQSSGKANEVNYEKIQTANDGKKYSVLAKI